MFGRASSRIARRLIGAAALVLFGTGANGATSAGPDFSGFWQQYDRPPSGPGPVRRIGVPEDLPWPTSIPSAAGAWARLNRSNGSLTNAQICDRPISFCGERIGPKSVGTGQPQLLRLPWAVDYMPVIRAPSVGRT